MDTKQKQEKNSISETRKYHLSLWEAPYTILHRAGVAGLYIALSHLEHRNGEVINWELKPDSITLSWECSDRDALMWLLQETYSIKHSTPQGIIHIPAMGALDAASSLNIHNGILSTFLQHGSSKKVDQKNISISIQFGDEPEQVTEFKYNSLNSYSYQHIGALTVFDKKGYFKPWCKIVSWLYPNASEKYLPGNVTVKMEECPVGLISLLFAPLACGYYKINSHISRNKYTSALVIPELDNLEAFYNSGVKPSSYEGWYVSSLYDAGLDYMLSKNKHTKSVFGCEVWEFGKVSWNQQQKPNINRKKLVYDQRIIDIYEDIKSSIPNKIIKKKDGNFMVSVLLSKEIVIKNLAEGHQWYHGLYDLFTKRSEVADTFKYETKYLQYLLKNMVDKNLMTKYAQMVACIMLWELNIQFGKAENSSTAASTEKVKEAVIRKVKRIRSASNFHFFRDFASESKNNPFTIYYFKHQKVDRTDFRLWLNANWKECLDIICECVGGYFSPWDWDVSKNILVEMKWKRKSKKSDKAFDSEIIAEEGNEGISFSELLS